MMYGPVLDYEAKRIRDAGKAEGEIFGLIRAAQAFGFSCAQQAEFLQAQLNISLSQAYKEIATFDKQPGSSES